jgi:hypothetical protein
MSMAERDDRNRPDVLPWIIMAVIAASGFGLYHLFPILWRAMVYQDCIATGRVTGC